MAITIKLEFTDEAVAGIIRDHAIELDEELKPVCTVQEKVTEVLRIYAWNEANNGHKKIVAETIASLPTDSVKIV